MRTDTGLQLVRPGKVAGDLIAKIFRIKLTLDAVVATVVLATVLTVALVFLLSYRLRAWELTTIFRLGCSHGAITGFVAAEISLIAKASAAIAFGLLALANAYLEPACLRDGQMRYDQCPTFGLCGYLLSSSQVKLP